MQPCMQTVTYLHICNLFVLLGAPCNALVDHFLPGCLQLDNLLFQLNLIGCQGGAADRDCRKSVLDIFQEHIAFGTLILELDNVLGIVIVFTSELLDLQKKTCLTVCLHE